MLRLIVAGFAAAALLAPARAYANYWVYCDNGKIAVDSRNPEQMRIARGSSFCQMGPQFSFASDAQSFAEKNFGGRGKARSCR